jgi:hypothetical protein
MTAPKKPEQLPTREQLVDRIDKLEARVTDALERLDRRRAKERADTPT